MPCPLPTQDTLPSAELHPFRSAPVARGCPWSQDYRKSARATVRKSDGVLAKDRVRAILEDRDYAVLERTRDALVHRRLRRGVAMTTFWSGFPRPPHGGRNTFPVGTDEAWIKARSLIETCRDLATRHLDVFSAALSRQQL